MKLTRNDLQMDGLLVDETLFHVANGYLGVRGNFEEGYPQGMQSIRGCYVNGFYDTVGLKYPERLYGFPEEIQRMVNLPDIQSMEVWLGDERYDPFEGTLLGFSRELDTDLGTTVRAVHWRSPKGKEVKLSFTRMASFARHELFLTLLRMESVNYDGECRVVCGVDCDITNFVDEGDPRVASEAAKHIYLDEVSLLADGGIALCHTGMSGLGLAVCQRLVGDAAAIKSHKAAEGFQVECRLVLHPGKACDLQKYTCISDSRRSKAYQQIAAHCATTAISAGAAFLLREQQEFLEHFWHSSRTAILGNPEMAEGMEFSLYGLLQSAGRDSMSNVCAKGLSGEGYEGHYFWDTEIYIFPFFLFTQPAIARNLLDYRYSILDGARAHAAIMGHGRGALYPWRTITGSECSGYFPSGSAQYHLNGDVAHSFLQYWYATGDLEYMGDKGAEVLLETARLWLDAGSYDRQGRFTIPDVTGPDEYTCIVNNNYYTNQTARHNLLGAVAVYKSLEKAGLHKNLREKLGLSDSELAGMERAAQAMYLPYDADLDIHAQDDSFLEKPVWNLAATPRGHFPLLLHYHPLYLYRHQVCKQPDTVLAHFLFEDGVNESTLQNSYNYYERITTHDSSLSTCVFSIMASRLGDTGKALEYYRDTIRTDLDNMHGNTKDGLHTANLGGAWLALVSGFGGLRLKPDGLHLYPRLPEGWDGYRFKLHYRGSLLSFQVEGASIDIALVGGEPVDIFLYGGHTQVNGHHRIKRACL